MLNDRNYDKFRTILKERNCLVDLDGIDEEENPANEMARKLLEKQKMLREKVRKAKQAQNGDDGLTMADLISIFAEAEHMPLQDVYDKYHPKRYMRRYNQSGNAISSPFDDTDNTGLLDPNNIIFTIDGEGGLLVENITLGSKYYFYGGERRISDNAGEPIAGVIETGQGYDVGGWAYDGVPRPFIQNTHDDLEQNHYHTEAMKRSLKKQGLEVK